MGDRSPCFHNYAKIAVKKFIRRKTVVITFFALFSMLCLGKDGPAKGSGQVIVWSTLPATTIVARVCGNELTKADFVQHEKMLSACYDNKYGVSTSENDKKKKTSFLKKARASASDVLVFETMILANCTNEIASLTKDQGVKAQKVRFRHFAKARQKFDDFKNVLSKQGVYDDFVRNVNTELAYEHYFKANYSNDLVVTDQDIAKGIERIKKYNLIVDKTNEVTLAAAKKLVRRARSGEDFKKLVKEFSFEEDREEGGDLGICWDGYFDDEPKSYWNAVSKLRPNEVSDVLSASQYYEIVKNIGTNSYNETDGIHLAHLCLRKAMRFDETGEADMREELAEYKAKKARKKAFNDMRKVSSVKYPLGMKPFESWLGELETQKGKRKK